MMTERKSGTGLFRNLRLQGTIMEYSFWRASLDASLD
jgi:hypothetical protein